VGILKQIAARGAYFIEIGASDPDSWSQLMIHDVGPNVRPFLNDIRQWSLIIVQKKAGAHAAKINCWDYKNCGRTIKDRNAKAPAICPAFSHTALNGINGGKNGGRSCWLIPGTLCGRRIQRSCVTKSLACSLCDFKRFVLREGNPDCMVSDAFLRMLIH